MFLTGADSVRGNFEPSEFHRVTAEDEFLWVEGNSMAATNVKPLDCLMEALLQGMCPEQGIVNAPPVPIARCNVTLGVVL